MVNIAELRKHKCHYQSPEHIRVIEIRVIAVLRSLEKNLNSFFFVFWFIVLPITALTIKDKVQSLRYGIQKLVRTVLPVGLDKSKTTTMLLSTHTPRASSDLYYQHLFWMLDKDEKNSAFDMFMRVHHVETQCKEKRSENLTCTVTTGCTLLIIFSY